MTDLGKCHYCGEPLYHQETECGHCGALLNGIKPGRKILTLFLSIGFFFALIILWVGFNLIMNS